MSLDVVKQYLVYSIDENLLEQIYWWFFPSFALILLSISPSNSLSLSFILMLSDRAVRASLISMLMGRTRTIRSISSQAKITNYIFKGREQKIIVRVLGDIDWLNNSSIEISIYERSSLLTQWNKKRKKKK